jgi:hypothetical protein
MLIPIVSTREHRAALVPDDLLRIQKVDAQQAVQNLSREDGRVPDVGDLQARYMFERLRPIRPCIAGDRCFCVARSAFFQIARLGGPAAIQAGAISPLRIEFDTVRRVRH